MAAIVIVSASVVGCSRLAFARRPVRNFLVTHGGVRAGFVIIPVHFNIIKHNVPFVTHLILSTEFADNIAPHLSQPTATAGGGDWFVNGGDQAD